MISIKLVEEKKPDELSKSQKVEYMMVLTRLLEAGIMVDKKIIDDAQDKIKQLIKEI